MFKLRDCEGKNLSKNLINSSIEAPLSRLGDLSGGTREGSNLLFATSLKCGPGTKCVDVVARCSGDSLLHARQNGTHFGAPGAKVPELVLSCAVTCGVAKATTSLTHDLFEQLKLHVQGGVCRVKCSAHD